MANKLKLDTTPLMRVLRTKEDRRRKNALGSRCSRCNAGVWFTGHKALNAFLNAGRVCDSCKAAAVQGASPNEYASRLATLNCD